MFIMVMGLILFLAIHIVPSTSLKTNLVNRIGVWPYRVLFSLVSIGSMVLIVYGKSIAAYQPLLHPPAWGMQVPKIIMYPATILVLAGLLPNNLRRFLRFPLLLGVMLWGLSHLFANGDLASVVLFASFTIMARLNMMAVAKRPNQKVQEKVPFYWDIVVVLLASLVFAIIWKFHGVLFGVGLSGVF